MDKTIAIVVPKVGIISETFIRKHVERLLPKNSVIISNGFESYHNTQGSQWVVRQPSLYLSQVRWGGLNQGLPFFVARKLGLAPSQDARFIVVKNFLNRHGVEAVLGEYLDNSFNFFEIIRRTGIPYFAHAHGADVSQALRNPYWQKKYLEYRYAKGIITMSNVSRLRLIEIGLEPSKIHVVPYGVDVPCQPIKREPYELVSCLAVGRMVAKKAPVFLLEAFRQASVVYPNLRLDYVGAGALFPAARQFIQAFDLQNKVILHGSQPNNFVQNLMQKSDIFLQHSIVSPDNGDEEGLPVAILEAMSHALPIISTRHSGIPEAVKDGETGFLADEGNCSEMAAHIVTLAKDPDLRTNIGRAGWQRAKGMFSWEKERTQLLSIMNIQ